MIKIIFFNNTNRTNQKQTEQQMKDQGLADYLTNFILRPHREIYSIDKLGISKTVVKSQEKSLWAIDGQPKNKQFKMQQPQKSGSSRIEVNRRQVTIRDSGKNIQASIYEPQLTSSQNKSPEDTFSYNQKFYKNGNGLFEEQIHKKTHSSYDKCVIFLHANSGSRLQALQYYRHVLQYRTLCVSFDYSGSGVSQGDQTTMGINQSKDLSSVIRYMHDNYQVKNFSLWGRSLGAVTGLYYILTRYQQDSSYIRITSCILDSPFSSLQKLIRQLAKKKFIFLQFIYDMVLKTIQSNIISQIGVNLFKELNLIEKINSLSPKQRSLLFSVNFLNIASKSDKMISFQHTLDLCKVISSKQIKQNYKKQTDFKISTTDQHYSMLLQFKNSINQKGDLIYIQGDHNRPRGNLIKQIISFFIQEGFSNATINDKNVQKNKQIHFRNTGAIIKTKLSFPKGQTQIIQKNVQNVNENYQLKSRNEQILQKNKIEQTLKKESITHQNQYLINLKSVKTKQTKQSLNKQFSQSYRNSLNKMGTFKNEPNQTKQTTVKVQKKQRKNSIQNEIPKGINVTSKYHPNNDYQIPSNHANHEENVHHKNKGQKVQKYPAVQNLANLLNKGIQNTPNYKNFNKKQARQISMINDLSIDDSIDKSINNSIDNSIKNSMNNTINNSINSIQHSVNKSINTSVNNSISNSTQKSNQQSIKNGLSTQDTITCLYLGQNTYPHAQTIKTHRVTYQKKFQNLPSDKDSRNQSSMSYHQLNKYPAPNHTLHINTTPFNISMDNKSHQSIDNRNHQSFNNRNNQSIDIRTNQYIDNRTDQPIDSRTNQSIQFRNSCIDQNFKKKQPQMMASQTITNTLYEINPINKPITPQNQSNSSNKRKNQSQNHFFAAVKKQNIQAQANLAKNNQKFNHKNIKEVLQSPQLNNPHLKNQDFKKKQPKQARPINDNKKNYDMSTFSQLLNKNEGNHHYIRQSANQSFSPYPQQEQIAIKQIMINQSQKPMALSSTFQIPYQQKTSHLKHPQIYYQQGRQISQNDRKNLKLSHINISQNQYNMSFYQPQAMKSSFNSNQNNFYYVQKCFNPHQPPKQMIQYKNKINGLFQ